MKKNTSILIGILCLTLLSLSAQQTTSASAVAKTPKQYGVQVGIYANRLRSTYPDDVAISTENKSATGFGICLFENQDLKENWRLHLETGWIQKGGALEETTNYATYTAILKLNYIHLAINPQYTVFKQPKVEVYLTGGALFGYALSGKTISKTYVLSSQRTTTQTQTVNVNNKDFRRFDYGLHLGAGVRLLKNIAAELRYSFGLSDTDKTKDFGDFNNALGLTVGYAF